MPQLSGRALAALNLARQVWTMPKVEIYLGNDENAQEVWRSFTARHPRYRVIGHKTLGVALLPVPRDPEHVMSGKHRQAWRSNSSRAARLGYVVAEFTSEQYFDDILRISLSARARQGRLMPDSYMDANKLRKYCIGHPRLIGVFRNGTLYAYLEPLLVGEVVIISRILGHISHLQDGIMYLIMQRCVESCIEAKRENPDISWIMYDTMIGRASGIRYFKERIGFEPYRVRWRTGSGAPTKPKRMPSGAMGLVRRAQIAHTNAYDDRE